MIIRVITLFPEMFSGPFSSSIIKRAFDEKVCEFSLVNLRDYALNSYGTVDDRPYGGGEGMILMVEPVYNALSKLPRSSNRHTILMSASGKKYTQRDAERLSKMEDLVIVCGHYEGVDERIEKHLVDETFSIGDFVMTGGEVPALAVIDSVVRLLPGTLKGEVVTHNESFSLRDESGKTILEYPHYTRPSDFRGWKVPEVLLSGNHAEVDRWRKEQAAKKTKNNRPDLLEETILK